MIYVEAQKTNESLCVMKMLCFSWKTVAISLREFDSFWSWLRTVFVRDFMKQALLEVYSDYLIISSSQTTATGLSKVLDNKTSHDSFTRFLSSGDFSQKDQWMLGIPWCGRMNPNREASHCWRHRSGKAPQPWKRDDLLAFRPHQKQECQGDQPGESPLFLQRRQHSSLLRDHQKNWNPHWQKELEWKSEGARWQKTRSFVNS